MTNYEKYKTVEERANAFQEFCGGRKCEMCKLFGCGPSASRLIVDCSFAWLDLEAEEEKIENCPYCGSECGANADGGRCGMVYCMNSTCGYKVWRKGFSRDQIIAAHNSVARAVMEAKKNEEN